MNDKRLRKPTFPDTEFGKIMQRADEIKYTKIYNYEYSYFKKTPNGFREDEYLSHTYGTDRDGYEKWKSSEDAKNLMVGYSGVISAREIINDNNKLVGYVFERKLPDEPWLNDLNIEFDKAWNLFCQLLDIKDEENVKYYLFKDVYAAIRDRGQETIEKLNIMNKVLEKFDEYEQYNDEDDKKFIDFFNKLKG